MKPRVVIARFLIRLGKFIQDLAIMVMRPNDLVEFTRQTYAKHNQVESWGSNKVAEAGLDLDEIALLDKIPLRTGRLLLLGIGGGREAIPLAKMGFEVTGVDFIPEMVKKAQNNALQQGIKIEGLIQEISKVEVPENSYDIVWLSAAMYSSIPTKERRVEMLKRISKALKPEGYFVCQFHWELKGKFSPKVELAKKIFAFITRGNLRYKKGDMLLHNMEFIHAFSSKEELTSELKEGGFKIIHFYVLEGKRRGGVVLTRLSNFR